MSPNKSIPNSKQDSLPKSDTHEKRSIVCNMTRAPEPTSKPHLVQVDPPQEWCDSLEGSDIHSTLISVPSVTTSPHGQSIPRTHSLLDTFDLGMDSSLSGAELSIQGTDKNRSLSGVWKTLTGLATGSIQRGAVKSSWFHKVRFALNDLSELLSGNTRGVPTLRCSPFNAARGWPLASATNSKASQPRSLMVVCLP